MSVNLISGINQDKVAKFGKYFGSIDFEVNSTSKAQLQNKGDNIIAGKFLIAGAEFDCSLSDLDNIIENCHLGSCIISGREFDCNEKELYRVIETCHTAKQVFFSKYRFGV